MIAPNDLEIGIIDVTHRLGCTSHHISELARSGHIAKDRLSKLTANGAENFFVEADATCEDMAKDVISDLLLRNDVDPQDVDLVLFTSTIYELTALYPDIVVQNVARHAGCRNAKTFSIHHAYCVSPFLAIKFLLEYLPSLETSNPLAVVVCADKMAESLQYLRPVGDTGVHSDGAAAILLAADGPRSVVRSVDIAMTANGGQAFDAQMRIAANPFFFAKLFSVLKNSVDVVPHDSRNNLNLCPNNLSPNEWRNFAQKLNISQSNIIFNPGMGHVFGGDPFINWSNRPRAEKSMTLLAASAAGSTYATALLEDV